MMPNKEFVCDFTEIRTMSSSSLAPASETDSNPNSSSYRDMFSLNEATVASLQEAMATGKLTARKIVELYIARIHQIDKSGPAVNAVIELNPDALEIATELDKEREQKGPRGPLHGIPVMLKDVVDTADKMKTSAGSLALADSIAPRDAFIVQRLRSAGAIILGKTNMNEWCNYRGENEVLNGWSARGGLTRNAYVLGHSASGSSGGSGVAVSANLCTVAVGHDTIGSLTNPSAINGVVGIKPTTGLISRSGMIPSLRSLETPGPMARTVTDAAILLGALAGVDSEDKATLGNESKTFTDYTQFLDPDKLRGARIGVLHNQCDDGTVALFHKALKMLRAAGTVIVNPADFSLPEEHPLLMYEMIRFELKDGLNKYLARRAPNVKVRSLAEVIKFNEANKDLEMPLFGQEIFLQAEGKGGLDSPEYLECLRRLEERREHGGADALLDAQKLDAVVSITNLPAPMIHVTGMLGQSFSPGIRLAGASCSPIITVPVGFLQGLPVGISFFGRKWSEPLLLGLAYSFEQASKCRKPPSFLEEKIA
jgi:amidase